MEHNSPSTYGPPNWATGYCGTNFKSPLTSPQSNRFQESPDFSPYSSSSPVKKCHPMNRRGGGRRYFNNSSGVFSNSSNFSSPNNRYYNRRNRRNYHVNSDSSDYCNNISLFFHPSMLEDPWKELEQKMKMDSNEINDDNPVTERDDLNKNSPVQN